ncbi:hypothetical protein COJ58_25070 [Bacillus thuringiensis]|uniref:hypothetical protein n=1 Tax=Bacillus thuringiensis TaxID=1428 RepID=UPI000BF914E6|nr:hypothetical protein [Bacillus thuringiensis]PFN48193.1 hypothetical protein COJ58_25070 [Bacillus thuringiensis]
MDLKEYYESVISELENHLLSNDKLYKEYLEETKKVLKKKTLSDSDVELLFSFIDHFYRLGRDRGFIETDIRKYKENLVEAEKRIEELK